MRIRFYENPAGQRPVERYLAGLESNERAEVETRPIDGKLWEIKVSRHRVFYVLLLGPELILLHAYKKQGQKAPKKEIDTARKRMRDVLS